MLLKISFKHQCYTYLLISYIIALIFLEYEQFAFKKPIYLCKKEQELNAKLLLVITAYNNRFEEFNSKFDDESSLFLSQVGKLILKNNKEFVLHCGYKTNTILQFYLVMRCLFLRKLYEVNVKDENVTDDIQMSTKNVIIDIELNKKNIEVDSQKSTKNVEDDIQVSAKNVTEEDANTKNENEGATSINKSESDTNVNKSKYILSDTNYFADINSIEKKLMEYYKIPKDKQINNKKNNEYLLQKFYAIFIRENYIVSRQSSDTFGEKLKKFLKLKKNVDEGKIIVIKENKKQD